MTSSGAAPPLTPEPSALYLKLDNVKAPSADARPNRREPEVYYPPTLPKRVLGILVKNWVKGFYFGYGIETLPHVVALLFGQVRKVRTQSSRLRSHRINQTVAQGMVRLWTRAAPHAV